MAPKPVPEPPPFDPDRPASAWALYDIAELLENDHAPGFLNREFMGRALRMNVDALRAEVAYWKARAEAAEAAPDARDAPDG